MSRAPRDWDAHTYDSLPLPHVQWGKGVRERLAPEGEELILELGCGSGRDAAALLQHHRRVRYVGLDASETMIARSREALADFGPRAELRQIDLREPWALETSVDAVFSVATLHWLPAHLPVFTTVAAALRPGGRFVADAGGHGQLGNVLAARAVVEGRPTPRDVTNFQGAEATVQALQDAGFEVRGARLRPDPLRLDPATMHTFLATIILGDVIRDMAPAEADQYVADVVEAMQEPVVDYVRLEFEAVRA